VEDDFFLHISLPMFTQSNTEHCYLLMENNASSNISVKSVALKDEDDEEKMRLKFDFNS
jgi:hypothetical protein